MTSPIHPTIRSRAKDENNSYIGETSVQKRAQTTVPMSKNAIRLWKHSDDIVERDFVPPPTPTGDHIDYQTPIETIPAKFPELAGLKLPYVREVGIKVCIEKLSSYFKCPNYRTNLLQFWFLDFITDCLWRCQDDFQLAPNDQKKVIEYTLHFLTLIIDTKLNYTRKAFVRSFKEIIFLIGDLIEEGTPIIPSPNELFRLDVDKNDNRSNKSSCSISSSSSRDSFSTLIVTSDDDVESNIAMKFNNETHVFKLPSQKSSDQIYSNISKPSSFDPRDTSCSPDDLTIYHHAYDARAASSMNLKSSPSVSRQRLLRNQSSFVFTHDPSPFSAKSKGLDDFYKPDLRTPPRFMSSGQALERYKIDEIMSYALDSDDGEAEYEMDYLKDMADETNLNDEDDRNLSDISGKLSSSHICSVNYSMLRSPRHEASTGTETTEDTSDTTINHLRLAEMKRVRDRKLKGWATFKTMEFCMQELADPNIGWKPAISKTNIEKQMDDRLGSNINFIEYNLDDMQCNEQIVLRKRINMVIVAAIIDCVFEYLYDNFHFILIKLAFQATPNLINQSVNTTWKVPKIHKGQFKRPLRAKVKTPKSMRSKSTSTKKSTISKKSKKVKKAAKKPGKKSKSPKSSKKNVKIKLSKEQKKENDRLKREQQLEELERKKQEENKAFMFPLADAATDDLFKSLFPDWKKPKSLNKKKRKAKE